MIRILAGKIASREARDLDQLQFASLRKHRAKLLEASGYDSSESCFQRSAQVRIARARPKVAQPLIALFEHRFQQPARALEIVVDVKRQLLDRRSIVAVAEQPKRFARSLRVQLTRILDDSRHRAEPRQPWHPPRDLRQSASIVSIRSRAGAERTFHASLASASSAARASRQVSCGFRSRGSGSSAARRNASSTRARISPAAFRVNVIASTCSGSSTCASSVR